MRAFIYQRAGVWVCPTPGGSGISHAHTIQSGVTKDQNARKKYLQRD